MNLHGIVRPAISTVNPYQPATLYRSTGSTPIPNAGGRRQPTYDSGTAIQLQKQAVSQADLKHLDNLNLQGELCKFWLDGALYGVVRVYQKGGDLITMTTDNTNWLVVAVMEVWPDWCSVIGQLQLTGATP